MRLELWHLVLVLIVFYIFFVLLINAKKKRKFSEQERKSFIKDWNRIRGMGVNESLIEADKTLHHYLIKFGFAGSVADILKSKGKFFTDINAVWFAHKIRNSIAHELNFRVNDFEYRKAIKGFETAFKDLGLIK